MQLQSWTWHHPLFKLVYDLLVNPGFVAASGAFNVIFTVLFRSDNVLRVRAKNTAKHLYPESLEPLHSFPHS